MFQGMFNAIRAPTLLDLQELHAPATIQDVSTCFMFSSIGIILGSLSGAILTDRLPKWADLGLAVGCVLHGTACGTIPWLPDLWMVGFMFGLGGMCQGTINVGVLLTPFLSRSIEDLSQRLGYVLNVHVTYFQVYLKYVLVIKIMQVNIVTVCSDLTIFQIIGMRFYPRFSFVILVVPRASVFVQ